MRAIFSGATCIWVIAHTLHLGGLPPCHLLNISLFALLDIEAEKLRGRNKKSGWGGDGGAHSTSGQQVCTLSVQRAEPSGQAWPITPWKQVLEQTSTSVRQTPVQRVSVEYWLSLEFWSHILMSNPNTCHFKQGAYFKILFKTIQVSQWY